MKIYSLKTPFIILGIIALSVWLIIRLMFNDDSISATPIFGAGVALLIFGLILIIDERSQRKFQRGM